MSVLLLEKNPTSCVQKLPKPEPIESTLDPTNFPHIPMSPPNIDLCNYSQAVDPPRSRDQLHEQTVAAGGVGGSQAEVRAKCVSWSSSIRTQTWAKKGVES